MSFWTGLAKIGVPPIVTTVLVIITMTLMTFPVEAYRIGEYDYELRWPWEGCSQGYRSNPIWIIESFECYRPVGISWKDLRKKASP